MCVQKFTLRKRPKAKIIIQTKKNGMLPTGSTNSPGPQTKPNEEYIRSVSCPFEECNFFSYKAKCRLLEIGKNEKKKSLSLLIFRCLSRSTGSHQVVGTNACLTRLYVNDTRRERKKNEKLSSGVRLSSRWKNKRVENKKKQNDNLN